MINKAPNKAVITPMISFQLIFSFKNIAENSVIKGAFTAITKELFTIGAYFVAIKKQMLYKKSQ